MPMCTALIYTTAPPTHCHYYGCHCSLDAVVESAGAATAPAPSLLTVMLMHVPPMRGVGVSVLLAHCMLAACTHLSLLYLA